MVNGWPHARASSRLPLQAVGKIYGAREAVRRRSTCSGTFLDLPLRHVLDHDRPAGVLSLPQGFSVIALGIASGCRIGTGETYWHHA